MINYLGLGSTDGTIIGPNAQSPLGFFGTPPVPQRSSPMQCNVCPASIGAVTTYSVKVFTPSGCVSMSAVEVLVTVTGIVTSTDVVLAINKPTCDAGIGIAGARVAGANLVGINYINCTAANATPTSGEIYQIVVGTSLNPIPLVITPTYIPSVTDTASYGTTEQMFTLTPTTTATGVTTINSAGQVTGIQMTNVGAGYYTAPAVIISGGTGSPPQVLTGTFSGLDAPTPTSTYPYGSGASAVAIIDGSGRVVGCQITNPGSGYQIAPAVTFVGGNNISPGMTVHVNKAAEQAGLGIVQARVVGNRQIAINYANMTTAIITPTAGETYQVIANNGILPVKNVVYYNVNIGTAVTAPASAGSSEYTFTVTGLSTTDSVIGVSKPTAQAVIVGNARISASNQLAINFFGGSLQVTPTASESYTVAVAKKTTPPVCFVAQAYFAPASVAANTTAEQAMPTVYDVPANTTVRVVKPTVTPGIAVVNARVSAANTITVTFANTTATAIVPPAEIYQVEVFTMTAPGAALATITNTGNSVSMPVSLGLNWAVDLVNEIQNTEENYGLELGY